VRNGVGSIKMEKTGTEVTLGGTMASLYTRKADRRRLAMQAMHKLGER
jgi:hypothetical protein